MGYERAGGRVEASRFGAKGILVFGRLLVAALLLLATGIAQAQELEVKSPAKREGKKDDPRARQRYLEELRAGKNGFVPSGARLRALREMDELIREEGERYWRFHTKTQGTSSTTQTSGSTGTSSGAAQDPSIANGSPTSSQWLFIGPRPTTGFLASSGRTSAIVVDPRDVTGNTVYVGGAQGGAWKSVDAGANWTALMDGPTIPSLAVGSMAIDGTTNPSMVYVGTGEQGSAFDSYYGAGILKSADGGTTWTQLGADKFTGPITGCSSNGFSCGGAFIGGLSVRPGGLNPATILAAVSLPTGLANASGIYRSIDGGTTWANVQAGTTSLGATAVQYATNLIAYAGFDGASGGVYKSSDGGATWLARNGGGANTITPGGRVELSVALSDTTGNTVYASVGASGGGEGLAGFYRTTDGGANWTRLGPVSAPGLVDYCTPQCWYDNVVAVNPMDANVVFVGGAAVGGHVSKTINGLAASNVAWAAATSNIHVDHHAAAFTPDGTRLYWGNDGGVYRTDNATAASSSATWTNLNTNLGITQFYTNFALHPTDINVTFGGTQDNGTQRYDGTQDISLAWTNTGACGDGAGNVIDASNPSVVYANCQLVDIIKSTNGGLSGFTSAASGISTSDRVLFIPPLVGDNYNSAPNHLYFGTYRVWQTRNQGASWQPISNDLTIEEITRLAVAPSDRTVMYAATDDGRVWKGTGLLAAAPNDCATFPTNCFTEITLDLLPAARRINALAVSPTDPTTVYVGHGGFGSSTTRRLSRRVGNGSWTDITGNLPNAPILDIAADPDIAGRLYVGTDIGVFMSSDDGATWSTLANGLPRVAVYGLKLHRASRTLRAATHGRGFWDLAVPATIAGPGGILIPSSLAFGARPLYTTSVAQNFSFTNHGSSPTTVGTVSVSGDHAITSNNCAGTLAPSASCNISVTFTPTSSGMHNNKVAVTTDAVNSPVVGGLSGLGAPPNDNFADAATVTLGAFTHRTNTLGATVEALDPTGSCDFSVPPHARNVWYAYTPGTNGVAVINTRNSNYDTVLAVFTGTQGSFAQVLNGCDDDIGGIPESPSEVTINVTAGVTYRIMVSGFVPSDGGELVFNLNGPAPLASLTRSKTSLTFANQAIGTSSPPQFFTLTAVTGTVNSIVAATTGDFSRTTDCPATLAQTASCTVNVTFTPTAGGTRNGSVSITSSGAGSPQSVTLTGTGDTLSLSPAVVNMSAVVGSSTPQTVTFFNGSGGPVTVSDVVVTGDYARTHNCTTVAHAGSCTINLTFTPAASGARNGVLTVTSSGGVRTATLNGTGVEFTLSLTRPVRPTRGSGSGIVIAPGQTVTVDLMLNVTAGAGERVQFECVGMPPGIACQLDTTSAYLDTGTQSIRATFSSSRSSRPSRLKAATPASAAGNYVVVVRAQVAGVERRVSIPLTVVAASPVSAPNPSEPRPQRLRR